MHLQLCDRALSSHECTLAIFVLQKMLFCRIPGDGSSDSIFDSGAVEALAAGMQVLLSACICLVVNTMTCAKYSQWPLTGDCQHARSDDPPKCSWFRTLHAATLCHCSAQAAPCRNVRCLGACLTLEDTSSCLAPGLFTAASALVDAMQVGMGSGHPACAAGLLMTIRSVLCGSCCLGIACCYSSFDPGTLHWPCICDQSRTSGRKHWCRARWAALDRHGDLTLVCHPAVCYPRGCCGQAKGGECHCSACTRRSWLLRTCARRGRSAGSFALWGHAARPLKAAHRTVGWRSHNARYCFQPDTGCVTRPGQARPCDAPAAGGLTS
jgi:hypothetical protein